MDNSSVVESHQGVLHTRKGRNHSYKQQGQIQEQNKQKSKLQNMMPSSEAAQRHCSYHSSSPRPASCAVASRCLTSTACHGASCSWLPPSRLRSSGSQMTGLLLLMVRSKVKSDCSVSTLRPHPFLLRDFHLPLQPDPSDPSASAS